MEERSPYDPRPAMARPVGTVDRVVADDGSVEVWEVVKVDNTVRERARLLRDLEEVEADIAIFNQWDEGVFIQEALTMERIHRANLEEILTARKRKIREALG